MDAVCEGAIVRSATSRALLSRYWSSSSRAPSLISGCYCSPSRELTPYWWAFILSTKASIPETWAEFCVRPRCILTQSGHFGQTGSRLPMRTETLTDTVESLGTLKTQVAR